MLPKTNSWTVLLGRALLSAIFLSGGLQKFESLGETAQWIASQGLPVPGALAVAAATVEVLGGLSLLLGFATPAAALVLALYLVPTSFVFHDFWRLSGLERELQLAHFLKNLAIGGGLLYVLAHGAGAYSLDRLLAKHGKHATWPTHDRHAPST